MLPLEFLSRVWPDTGVYALATPFTIPNTQRRTYAHKTFDSIAEAASYATRHANTKDLYFAVHALREHRVWDPMKLDLKTNELGAWTIRTQANTRAARCFFLDLDVGTSTDRTAKYSSQAEALQALIQFCTDAQLPRPMLTSSGGGIHVYWILDEELASLEWRQHATALHQLVKYHGLKADPMRVVDTASVLRVAGTANHKNPLHPRPVRVLHPGLITPTQQFLKLLQDAVIRASLTVRTVPMFEDHGLGNNLDEVYDGPPVAFRAIVKACGTMRDIVKRRASLSEPEWYHTLNLVRFAENGDAIAHHISKDYPGYSDVETDKKLGQLAAKNIKPTSCAKLAEVAGDGACLMCAFAGKVKSPIVAARFKDPAPAPVLSQLLGTTLTTTEIPPPPFPYMRLKTGAIAVEEKNKDGDETHVTIYAHDIHPTRRLVNTASVTEQQMWRVVLPREGAKEFVLDADALYDRRKFVSALANQGIYPHTARIPDLQDYMIAYISELQRLTDAEQQCNHLGWTDDQTKFILPDRILLDDGTARPAVLSVGASRSTAQVHKRGDLATQVQLLNFFNHPAYHANQFFVLASLGAPLFYATGHHGVIVNASGPAGSSKSTSLYTAASFWGQPELYPINGTNNGATVRARNERITTLANLPVCVDEVTNMPVREVIDLAMGITQPGHRLRLTTEGIERNSVGSYKATIMLSTANNSLHGLLSTDNAAGTAGSMRVVEIQFNKQLIHEKYQADEYWHQLKQHYGHIGEAFMSYVIQHREAVNARVRAAMKQIDHDAAIESSERFWSATIAAVLVAGEIAHELGLLSFNMPALRAWALNVQVPYMRGVVVEEYASPVGLLADYLESINGNILVTSKASMNANISNVMRGPHGQLLAHYDTDAQILWVLKKGFKDYCVRVGANFLKILDDLHVAKLDAQGKPTRVIASKQTRKILGSGTEYGKAQSWCFSINMRHPEIIGAVDVSQTAPVLDRTLKLA